ncbi:N-acetylglucosamine kinase [Actinoallomurus rhizosphaericola]|uniref:N-acetylglucosamine kinase n=1 Tax=Actinoallomurus rhizosphaericola TaxID=2952536 RepID=UPI0020910F4E|nr:BadF/BadG/BcrA/BcrD ATPase family protein [Actinoallomurus rhizosphaericola]MCO5994457.1 hypothetical protein [Actinoallomurus rhizosphaericola]
MTDVVAGFDVGATKTRLRAETPAGEAVVDLTWPSGDWRRYSYPVRAKRLADLLEEALGAGSTLVALAVGAHGCDSAEQCARFQEVLAPLVDVPCTVVNDAELIVPASGRPTGIGLIAGTGSIAVGRTSDGETLYAGGWGWFLGDDGGGAGLVREAARAVLRARDRGHDDDPLIGHLLQALQLPDTAGISTRLTTGTPEWWAGCAPVVFAAHRDGSAAARHVIESAGRELAELVRTLADRGASADRVVAAGGVIVHQPPLLAAFTAALGDLVPGCRVEVLTEPPVNGAVRLARALATA